MSVFIVIRNESGVCPGFAAALQSPYGRGAEAGTGWCPGWFPPSPCGPGSCRRCRRDGMAARPSCATLGDARADASCPGQRAIGSAGERLVHTEEVTGSIPVSPTARIWRYASSEARRIDLTLSRGWGLSREWEEFGRSTCPRGSRAGPVDVDILASAGRMRGSG
jgi:hypothetical protein